MKRFAVVLSLILSAIFASPRLFADEAAKYTYHDLIGHRDRWPAVVTLKKDFKKRTAELHAGEQYKIFNVTSAGVTLDLGADKPPFPIPPDGSDIVEAANAKAAGGGGGGGPEPAKPVRLDEAAVIDDASLWPAKIKLSRPLRGADPDGKAIALPAGAVFTVANIDQQGVLGISDDTGVNLTLPFNYTNLLQAAGELSAMEADKRPSRIVEFVRGKTVDASGKAADPPGLDGTKIFVFYIGANWCQPCHNLSPNIVKWVNANAGTNPHMTVVMLDADEKDSQMLAYMNDGKMPWTAIRRGDWSKSLFTPLANGALPQVIIMDRFGRVLSNLNGGGKQEIQQHLAALTKVADGGAAK